MRRLAVIGLCVSLSWSQLEALAVAALATAKHHAQPAPVAKPQKRNH